MRLVNKTRGTVLAESVERAVRMKERMKGLLGRTGLAPGTALAIAPCTSIHTFFMKFSIDVAFLDADHRVVRALGDVRPWRATRIYPSAAQVVELPAGTLAQTGTVEGDSLAFEGV